MRFEIEYLIRDTSKREIQTRGRYRLLAKDEAEARGNCLPVIAENEETDRTDCFIEIIACTELTWQETYGLTDELAAFVESGVLEPLSEDIRKRRVEFLIPAAGAAGSPVRRGVYYKLVWHHPGNSPDTFDYEGSNFYLQQEIDDLGSQLVPDTDTVEELAEWLDMFRSKTVTPPEAVCRGYFSKLGHSFCVPATMLDSLERLMIAENWLPLVQQLRDESKRIIQPLVWTVEDLPDLNTLNAFDDVIPEGGQPPELGAADYDDAGELDYAISQVNEALDTRVRHLLREHFNGKSEEAAGAAE